jgi:hypothetical protein
MVWPGIVASFGDFPFLCWNDQFAAAEMIASRQQRNHKAAKVPQNI